MKKSSWYHRNKERALKQHREYRKKNAAKVFAWHKKYREENKEKRQAWWNASPLGVLGRARKLALLRCPTENAVTTSELMQMWKDQEGKCSISGEQMTWSRGGIKPNTLSIDRIDPIKGYTKANVRLICYQVNTFKGGWSDHQMLSMARTMIAKADYQLAQEAA